MAKFNSDLSREKFTDWAAFRETGSDIAELAENKVFSSGLTKEEFEALELAWQDFLFQLEFELPAEKRKEILLTSLRENYQWEIKKLSHFVKDYDDSRAKGESYDIRKKMIEQNSIVKKMHKETTDRGNEVKRQAARALTLEWLDPLSHLEEIQEIGIEAFYKKRCALGLLL